MNYYNAETEENFVMKIVGAVREVFMHYYVNRSTITCFKQPSVIALIINI